MGDKVPSMALEDVHGGGSLQDVYKECRKTMGDRREGEKVMCKQNQENSESRTGEYFKSKEMVNSNRGNRNVKKRENQKKK